MFGKSNEHRRQKRHKAGLNASYAQGSTSTAVGFRRCHVENINVSGVCIRTDEYMELGKEYQLIIHSPEKDEFPIHATVEIVRVVGHKDELFSYGAVFKNLSGRDRKRLSA